MTIRNQIMPVVAVEVLRRSRCMVLNMPVLEVWSTIYDKWSRHNLCWWRWRWFFWLADEEEQVEEETVLGCW